MPATGNSSRRFARYFTLARKYGLREAARKGREKLVSYAALHLRATWYRLRPGPLPSDRAILRRAKGHWKTVDELIDHAYGKASPAFLFSAGDKGEYVAAMRERYPANVDRVLRSADRICQHRFRLLGQEFRFAAEIDWHLDPESGRSWPKEYFEKIDRWMWSGKRLGDYKLVWELNRHQYFVTLGKAYWLTGNARYAEEFAQQVLSWIDQNPAGIGINWYSALEIGVRLISWALALHFFRDSPDFVHKAGKPFLKSVYQQVRFLREHLTLDWEVRNNHIIGEAAALIFVGSLLPEFSEADDWLRLGLQTFECELSAQTFSDGANKEQSTSYHRFVLDFLLLVVVLARRGAIPVSSQLEKLLDKMLNYTMYVSAPNGGIPMIGDADDGRGYVFSAEMGFWDFRAWLAAGSVLCTRPDFKFVAQDFSEEAFWLLGPQGLRAFEQLQDSVPREISVSFTQAGHYVIRDSWTEESDFALFKVGPFGLGGDGFCAHSHCDQLSLVLYIRGKPTIVDSGTYTYHGPWRNHFRLTLAHNTLRIDGKDQAVPINEFFWAQVPETVCEHFDGQRVRAVIPDIVGVTVGREIRHPAPGLWCIEDDLSGQGELAVEWFFHFAPNWSLRRDESFEHFILGEGGSPYVIVTPPPGVRVDIRSGWYSSRYGYKEPNPLLKATWHGRISGSARHFGWKFEYAGKTEKQRR